MERYKTILIAVGVVLCIACLVIFGLTYLVHVKPRLSPQEQQLAQYQYQKVEINERKSAVYAALKNPFTVSSASGISGKGYPAQPLAELAPQGKEEKAGGLEKPPGVSLVVIKDRRKMAIINGEVVKEGDRTKNGKVLRITKNGVLMKSEEGERWINIE